jgi:hypothetical protein
MQCVLLGLLLQLLLPLVELLLPFVLLHACPLRTKSCVLLPCVLDHVNAPLRPLEPDLFFLFFVCFLQRFFPYFELWLLSVLLVGRQQGQGRRAQQDPKLHW